MQTLPGTKYITTTVQAVTTISFYIYILPTHITYTLQQNLVQGRFVDCCMQRD